MNRPDLFEKSPSEQFRGIFSWQKQMQIIRTHDELVGSAAQPTCTEYAEILQSRHDRLRDFDLSEVAIITVTSSVQALTEFQRQTGHQLVDDDGSFRPVEITL